MRWRSGGLVIKLLAGGAEGRDSIPGLADTSSDNSYLLFQSRDMAERSLKLRKFSKQSTQQELRHNIGDLQLSLWHS